MKKRFISWLLTLTMIMTMLPASIIPAFAAFTRPSSFAGEYDVSDLSQAKFENGKTYRLHGTGTTPVVIASGTSVTIVLDGVTIESTTSPIQVQANATLRLVAKKGTANTLTNTSITEQLVEDNQAQSLTAGISVPKGATLYLEADSAGDGTLTVTGGYGGAGIGGSYTGNLLSQKASAGGTGSFGETGYSAAAGPGGNGGEGGLYGDKGTDAGTIEIGGGIVNITGGTDGVGIGGGKGTNGKKGDPGKPGVQGMLGYDDNNWHFFGSGGSGGGGAGGNGGTGGIGGDSGDVTIRGGAVTIRGTGNAVAIGGGSGGTGGAGGDGGDGGAAIHHEQAQETWVAGLFIAPGGGGKGGDGENGYGGRGGTGGTAGTLTIRGGMVSAIGTKGYGGGCVGQDGEQNLESQDTTGQRGKDPNIYVTRGVYYGTSSSYDFNVYHQTISSGSFCVANQHKGGAGGTRAAQDTNINSDGRDGTLTISGSSNNVDFSDSNGSTSAGNTVIDKNGTTLYRTVITVKNLEDTEVIANATISVPVTEGGTAYNYETVADSLGRGILWLPAGTYVLKGKMVQSSAAGYMTEEKTLTVAENHANTLTVNVGIDLTVKTSTASKVYFSDDAEKPLNLVVDASRIDVQIQSIRWFREPVNDNDQLYGTGSVLVKPFSEGYDAADTKNKQDGIDITGKTINIPVNQNGRYWFEIVVNLTGSDGAAGTLVTLVKPLTVSNIYREYSIQVKSVELDQKGNPKGNPDYAPLKTALGTDYAGSYGFAWDLNGYQSQTLVKNPSAGFDTVQINGLNSKVKWYNANFGTQNTTMNKNAAKTGFEPITLTLDQDFLTANRDADKGANGQTDPTKYTITYSPEGVPVAEVTIRGVVLEDDGATVKDEKWSYTQSYPEGVANATVTGNTLENYRIEKVLVNGVDRSADLQNGSIYLENLQGTEPNNYNDAITEVMFVYVDNTAEITINAYLEGTTTQVDGLNQIKVRAEIGKPFTYPQPTVSGYDNVGVDPANGTINAVAEQGNVINFYYLKSTGNVTYQAMDADGNTLLATKSETIDNGGAVNKTTDKANALFTIPYYTLTGEGTATADTYNGKDDVTVTYTYTRNTHKLTVVKKDVDSKQAIPGAAQEITNVPAGKTYTFGPAEITAVNGYSAVDALNPTSHMMGDADESITFWYRKNEANRYVTITVESVCDGKVFQSYPIPAFKDVSLTVPAPTWTGYKVKDGTDRSKTIIPTANETIQFEYELDSPRTITVELNNNTDGGTLTAPQDYRTSYVLKKGDSITIQAPVINGYALVSGSSVVTVDYDTPLADDKVVFNYASVATTNFVKHTIKFTNEDESIEFYNYSTLVAKGNGTTAYDAATVHNVIAGYQLADIRLHTASSTADVTNSTSVDAPNSEDALIVYRFSEVTAQIVIKQMAGGTEIGTKTLTGYRAGLKKVVVTAPFVDGYALSDITKLTQTISELRNGDNEVTFEYVAEGDVSFRLKERNPDTGKVETIAIVNGATNTTYDPNTTGNALDLSGSGYTFDHTDTDATPPFNAADGKVEFTTTLPSIKTHYNVFYTKNTRNVQFVAIDSGKYPQPADMADFDEAAAKNADAIIVTRDLTEKARIGESYKASAQSVDRYALDDQISKYYVVDDSNETLKVYFWYRAKNAGTVTVHYHYGSAANHDAAALLMSYSLDAVVGEKVIISIPEYLMDGKYKLPNGAERTQTKVVGNGDNQVEIYYDANFVTVNVKTKRSDFADAAEYESHEVIKTDVNGNATGNLTLTPPYRAGYTLVGITGVDGGSATKLPDSYRDGKLTLTGLTANTEIVYYYNKTSATEYQSDLTIRYQYNGYALAADKTVKVNRDEANTIDIPSFEGYKASTYTFEDGNTKHTTEQIGTNGISITPTAQTGTLTITYVRPDNTIVLPGKDDKIPSPDDKDNIIVKPGDKTPTIDGDGKVTIPGDSNGTVIRPDPVNPDKKEEITVPGGTTIDKDGNITLPEPRPNGTVIAPDTKLPDGLPADSDYVVITYNANNSTGEIKKELGKKNELTVKANPFTGVSGATFVEWNDNGNGNGKTYNVTDTVSKSVVLYAQWKSSYKYSATITYKPNGGTPATDSVQIVGSDADSNLIATIAKNSFSVSGWDFGGWNEQANGSGKLYLPGAKLPMQDGATQDLYAQWYKQTGSSITVPGKDGDPNNEQTNVTGKGDGISRDPDTGVITIPNGGTITVTKPNGDKETILLPNGGTLNPDGSYTIKQPDGGKIEVDKDGTETPKDDKGNEKTDVEIVTMTYRSNNDEDGVVNVKAIKGEDAALIANPFKWSGYKFLNWMGTDKKEYQPGDTVKAAEGEFFAQWYKQTDGGSGSGSIELPGKDGAIEAPNDKDNVIVTPGENGTLDGPKKPDGSVEVKGDEGTVTRPDPNDPSYPNGSKEDIKVPAGSVISPDGTIKLPDGTVIKPDQKYPDEVIPKDYVIVTYEPNGGTGNVVRQMVKTNEVTAILDGSLFTAPRGKTFDKWLDEDNNKTYAVGDELTTGKDVTLKAKWKTSDPTPTTYSAEIKFDPNTDEAAATQTLTGTTGEILSGKLDAYADHFTAPADWTFMGWSTARAASQNTTFYEDEASITLRDKDTLDLYAIVYKVDADSKVVTLPGADGKADSNDDVTVTPANGSTITPGKGYVEAPAGSTITLPGNKTITVIEGTVKVYPDGSVYVPDGSKVKLPDDKVVDGGNGGTTVKPDGTEDTDKTKPIQKPDGTIILPGEDGKTGTGDDIIVKPNGDKPAGRIDADGNVTITAPDGADVTIPGNDPADVKVPNGTVITPNGDITLVYTIKYVDKNGKELKTAATKRLKVGEIETVKAVTIDGYKVSGDETHTINAAVSADLKKYVITFTYEKKATGGNTGGGGSSGGGSSSGGSSSGGSSSGSGTTKPSQPDTKPTPGTKPNDPTQTGIANWLRTDKHTTSMTGYGNGKFGPEDSVTRAQVAQIFYRLLKDQNVAITASFSDVADDAWYAKAVNTLASLGIIKGTSEGKFDPNRAISRAEFCAIATRFAKVASTVKNPFADINEQDWYYTAVTTAASYDWVNGMNDGNFHPHDVISRAQAATIINRMLGAAADRNYVDSHVTNPYTDVSTTHWAYYQIIEASIAHDHDYDKEGVEIWTGLK
mgnify:CR=1 FL=1